MSKQQIGVVGMAVMGKKKNTQIKISKQHIQSKNL